MQVKGIAECSKGSILHYFLPFIKLPFVIKTFFVYFYVAVLNKFYCIGYLLDRN